MTDIIWLDENETEPRKQNFAIRQLLERVPGIEDSISAITNADFATRALAVAATVNALTDYIRIAGYTTAGDGGGALYKRVVSLASGLAGFQSADGAWWQLAESVVSVLMTGAVGDGGTDDTAAIQLAITSSYLLGRIVTFPTRTAYLTTNSLNITHATSLRGSGQQAAIDIYPNNTAAHAIVISTTEAVDIRDLSIIFPSAASTGVAGVVITAPSLLNGHTRITNCCFTNASDGVQIGAAAYWIIEKCFFSNIGRIGVYVRNTYQTDSGDTVIQANSFVGIGLASVYYESSSGLRFINNKVNDSFYGLLMVWLGTQSIDSATNVPGADLWISNNSMEGIDPSGACVLLSRADAASFGTIIISDNELSGTYGVQISASGNFIINLVITGNIMLGDNTAVSKFVELRHTRGYVIANNFMQSRFNNSIVVDIDATCDTGVVGPNVGWGTTTFAASTTSGLNSTTISPT